MTSTRERLREVGAGRLPAVLRAAGVSGAGGGGFPAYAKWRALDDVQHLLVNHQESEPNCYVDKWIGSRYAEELAALFDGLLESCLETVVVGAKRVDRDPWLRPLERATGGTVYGPDDLPVDVESASGVVFAYTDDTYEFGMENLLLRVTTGETVGTGLPVDHGWIVQNTETVYNIHRAVVDDAPVLRKYVHVDGFRADGRRLSHRMLDVPVGTPGERLLAAAGAPTPPPDDLVLAEGGPGWCFELDRPPDRYGVRKHTNCLLLFDEATVAENDYANDRVDALDALDWSLRAPETEPTRLDPDRVRVPVVTDEGYGDLVAPSTPVVAPGDRVEPGDRVAEADPADGDGFCVAHHAPIPGRVTDVTAREVAIRRTDPDGA